MVAKLIRQGELQGMRIGSKKWVVTAASVERYLAGGLSAPAVTPT